MKVKALQSFTGVLTMHKGMIADCDNEVVVRDLLEAGYVELVETKIEPETESVGESQESEPETESVGESQESEPETESAEGSQEGESEGKPAEESQSDESTEVAPAQPKAPKKGVKKSEGK